MNRKLVNVLRVLLYTNPPRTVANAADLIDQTLATAMHSMRVDVTITLNGYPGYLVFGRDIFLDIPLIADCKMIHQQSKTLVNERLRQLNQGRRSFGYIQGQRVLKKKHRSDKLRELTDGPYLITRVHTNGIVSIELRPNVIEQINTRRLIPYRETT